ncbi:hypothetical protein [Actinomadura fibrosa]|uniref:Uncharacterized protein n=1 Tax=Actinomadura fibrosa TaxID=111802 RepID=A0ABW2XHW5_9ACTN|nr:hypothetical protein [Actinomadura fibrosa]
MRSERRATTGRRQATGSPRGRRPRRRPLRSAALAAGTAALACGMTMTAWADAPAPKAATNDAYAAALNGDGVVVGYADGPVRWEADGRITRLPDLTGGVVPGGASDVYNVNDAAVAVGVAETDPAQTIYTLHAARWDANGAVTDLDAANVGGLSFALDVDAAGNAVGWSNPGGRIDAVRWDPSGQPHVLATLPGGDSGSAVAINDSGAVAGAARDSGGTWQAARWSPGGAVTALGPVPGQTAATVNEINASGAMVGEATVSGGERAVRWSPAGTPTLLSALPGHVESRAADLNDSGVAAGVSQAADGTPRAVRWDPNGQVAELPALPGTVRSEAYGINNAGAIVGNAYAGGRYHAVRWNPDGTVTDLGTLPAASEARHRTAPRVTCPPTQLPPGRDLCTPNAPRP